ncbi:tRNA modification GTPase MnmE [Anaerohalosphaera lusitana]|uniref:tRNA modification GTPase MnmE n=1 Tax=Anaerohalosphaera lusitana TaxID=1936003 RepID=A0A1U9NQ84_9BACT|nr:GTPase [Anaerohalosphaera lusitana]AQT69894.1 tRNA modification GTPase MnmE [Anaerohalosphaera lusitana]
MSSLVFAAVVTGRGVSAIASVEVRGAGAARVLGEMFRTGGGEARAFEAGRLYTGDIVAGERVLDNVVVAVRGEDDIAINCHGNPLIVEEIVRELAGRGVQVIEAEELVKDKRRGESMIAAESRVVQCRAATLVGAEIAAYQTGDGLAAVVERWSDEIERGELGKVRADCGELLAVSERARLFVEGCRIVLAGPPNGGKSTLMNTLAGRQRSIVTEQAGTTRDWVSSDFRIGGLAVELVDTAGLDEVLAGGDVLEERAQQRTKELIEGADMVLYVVDASEGRRIERTGLEGLGRCAVAVLNKADLGRKLGVEDVGYEFDGAVEMSAVQGSGVDELCGEIMRVLEVEDYKIGQAAAITDRQRVLLERLLEAGDAEKAKLLIAELRDGEI